MTSPCIYREGCPDPYACQANRQCMQLRGQKPAIAIPEPAPNFEPCYCAKCDGKLPAPCRYGTGSRTSNEQFARKAFSKRFGRRPDGTHDEAWIDGYTCALRATAEELQRVYQLVDYWAGEARRLEPAHETNSAPTGASSPNRSAPGSVPVGAVSQMCSSAQAAWDAVNALIKPGDLGGNGWDKNAERNGLILAANAIAALPGVRTIKPSPEKTERQEADSLVTSDRHHLGTTIEERQAPKCLVVECPEPRVGGADFCAEHNQRIDL